MVIFNSCMYHEFVGYYSVVMTVGLDSRVKKEYKYRRPTYKVT